MISALYKSRQLYLIALDRVSDYFDLLRVELKIHEHNLALRLAGFAIAGLFALLATVFLGVAIIVSFWDTPAYRAIAAWFVVLLYGGIAGIALNLCLKHFRSQPIANTLRTEFRRDLEAIRESV